MRSNSERFWEKVHKDKGLRKKVLDLLQEKDFQGVEKLAAKNACPAHWGELSKSFKHFKGELTEEEMAIVAAAGLGNGHNHPH